MSENKTAKELSEDLFYQKKSVYQKKEAADIDKAVTGAISNLNLR